MQRDTNNNEIEDFFYISSWPKQLILSNLSDGNSLKVIKEFQYYFPSPTWLAY